MEELPRPHERLRSVSDEPDDVIPISRARGWRSRRTLSARDRIADLAEAAGLAVHFFDRDLGAGVVGGGTVFSGTLDEVVAFLTGWVSRGAADDPSGSPGNAG